MRYLISKLSKSFYNESTLLFSCAPLRSIDLRSKSSDFAKVSALGANSKLGFKHIHLAADLASFRLKLYLIHTTYILILVASVLFVFTQGHFLHHSSRRFRLARLRDFRLFKDLLLIRLFGRSHRTSRLGRVLWSG